MPAFLNRPYLLPATGIAVTILVIAGLIQIPALAKNRLAQTLADAGFRNAQIGAVSVRPSSIVAENIKLDEYGFDEIKALSADINWPAFLFTGKINGLTIQGVKLGRDSDNIGSGSRQLAGTLLNLPDYRIILSGLTLDITTDFGEIRLQADAQVNSDNNPAERDIKARVTAEQYQLGFDSSWQGVLKNNGQLDLTASVEGGRLNAGPLRISRFNGWVGASVAEGKYEWQSQMEAGSASFMDVPLQNITLVNEYKNGLGNGIIRSGVSGMPDVLFTGDFSRAKEESFFTAILSGKNLGNFLDYIEEATGRKKVIRDAFVEAGPFQLITKFEAEKRFVGGPLPFSVSLTTDGKTSVDGNLLFYPDTLDLRGSLEADDEMAQAMQEYFKIPPENMRQNFIRLDGDARRFFYMGKQQAAAPVPEEPATEE